MIKLLYSNDKRLFFVTSFYLDNESNVIKLNKVLAEQAQLLADEAKVSVDEVKTIYIESSRRYKGMRCFYIETKTNPCKDALVLENHSLYDWLRL